MSRTQRIASGPAPVSVQKVDEITVRIELVTQQFGGGTKARVVDRDRWLRPLSVRGALRMWWRALFGARLCREPNGIERLRAAEGDLFGLASGEDGMPGRIDVIVAAEPVATNEVNGFEPRFGDAVQGAYFPAQGNNDRPAAQLLQPGKKGTITVRRRDGTSDDQWDQMKRALQAFILFGGSGSRTRKTAGALTWLDEKEARSAGIPVTEDELKSWARALPRGTVPQPIFALDDREGVWVRTASSPAQAQKAALELWRDLRQWRRHPDNWQGREPWGRSDWPEADAIRHLARTHSPNHAPRAPNIGKAPRAHLGLPIVVHFKPTPGGDPRDHRVVLDDDHDRYASPVLLSVTRLAGNPKGNSGAGWAALVLVTRSRLPGQVALRGAPTAQPLPTLSTQSWADNIMPRLREKLAEHQFTSIEGELQ